MALLTILTVLIAGCAVPQRQPLSLHDRNQIKSSKLILNTAQREIAMQHTNWFSDDLPDPYQPMDSGAIVQRNSGAQSPNGLLNQLIIAGIEHHGATTAQKKLTPIRQALGSFDYIRYFKQQISKNVASIPWLKARKEILKYNIYDNELALATSSKQKTVMFIGTTYALNSSFNRLEVVAYVKLDQNTTTSDSNKAQKKFQTLYKNNFYYVYRLHRHENSERSNIAEWTKNHAGLLKAKLKNAANTLGYMIALDIKNPSNSPYTTKPTIRIRTLYTRSTPGYLVTKKSGIYIVSLTTGGFQNGFMYAINKNSIRH